MFEDRAGGGGDMWHWEVKTTGKKKGIGKQESERNMKLDHRPVPGVLPFAVLDCN